MRTVREDSSVQKCEVFGFLNFISAPGFKVLTPAPGVTPDLRKLRVSYTPNSLLFCR